MTYDSGAVRSGAVRPPAGRRGSGGDRRPADRTEVPRHTLLEGVERNAIIQMLKETNGNKLETAKRLGIGRQTLYNKIKAYGIET